MTEHTTRMAFPYPGREETPWYDGFEDMLEAMDASGYAAREDRSLIWLGGGTVSWDLATQTFAWTAAIEVSSPISGLLIQVAAGSITLRDGDTMYIELTRYPTQTVTAVPVAAYQIPANDNVIAFAVRRGDVVYMRTGLSLGDGDSSDGVAPAPSSGGASLAVRDDGALIEASTVGMDFVGSGVTVTLTAPGQVQVSVPGADRHSPAIIVGNSGAGDTLLGCHYLDTGNGAQLAAAIAAAAVGTLKDVYVRRGTYNLDAVGGPVDAISIPDGVRVRGAGSGITVVQTRGSGDQRAFELGQGSKLEDVSVLVTLPTGAGTVGTGIVALLGPAGDVRRVDVDFLGTWTGTEAANFAIDACFYVGGLASGCKLIDCRCGTGGDGQAPSIWTLTSGAQRLYGVLTAAPPQSIGCDLVRFKCLGADEGVNAGQLIRVRDAEISDPELIGVNIHGADSVGSEVTGTLVEMNATLVGRIGIYLASTSECDVEGNRIVAWTGYMGAMAILLEAVTSSTIVKNRVGTNWGIGINLDSDTEDNIVTLNNMPSSMLNNSGTGNEVAHNINGDFLVDP